MIEEQARAALAEYPCLKRVFGELIEARLDGQQPDGFLIEMLATKHHMLRWWESRTCKYLEIVDSPEDAISGLTADLLGVAEKSSKAEFNGRLKDAVAEICAAVELSLRGGTEFHRIHPPTGQGNKVPDFECVLPNDAGGQDEFCVEVKNFRAPAGIIELVKELYDERAKTAPEILKRSIHLSHHWDNTVTDEQEAIIREFFSQLATCGLPYETVLTIDDDGKPVPVKVWVREGAGVCLT
jgi:hypothetical protein